MTVNKKWYPVLVILVLGIVLFLVNRYRQDDSTTPTKRTDPAARVDHNRGFDRRISYIEYSKHAKCRMKCRKITQKEVEQIMKEGSINYKKSDLDNARCPRYALEGITPDNQTVRIVFAQCEKQTTVVTVIDLGTDWSCDCPGDDN